MAVVHTERTFVQHAQSFHVGENEISSFTYNHLTQSDSSLQVMIEGTNA